MNLLVLPVIKFLQKSGQMKKQKFNLQQTFQEFLCQQW